MKRVLKDPDRENNENLARNYQKFKVSHLGLIRNVSKQLENKILENAAVAPSIDAKKQRRVNELIREA